VLFAFELFLLQSGSLKHLLPGEQAVFAVTLASNAVSMAALTIVLLSRELGEASQDRKHQMDASELLLVAGNGALACALAGDFFVAAARASGSDGVGVAIGALILLLVYMPLL
jgi:hypothetical protein